MANPPQAHEIPQDNPSGLGGWLLLPVVFVLLSPFYIAWRLLRNARTAVAMASEGGPFSTGLLIFLEFAVTAAMFAGALYLLYLLARRRALFREAYISFMLGGVLMAFVGLATTLVILGSEVDSAVTMPDLLDLRGLVGSALWAAVFIPYMHRSRRVKNTFTVQ